MSEHRYRGRLPCKNSYKSNHGPCKAKQTASRAGTARGRALTKLPHGFIALASTAHVVISYNKLQYDAASDWGNLQLGASIAT